MKTKHKKKILTGLALAVWCFLVHDNIHLGNEDSGTMETMNLNDQPREQDVNAFEDPFYLVATAIPKSINYAK